VPKKLISPTVTAKGTTGSILSKTVFL